MAGHYQAYPEYKDSGVEWLGGMPNHWEAIKLKYVADLEGEKVEPTPEQRYVGMENVESGNGRYLEKEDMKPEGLSASFTKDDVLFGKLRPYLAKSWMANFSGICSSEFLILRSQKVSPRFLNYFTLTNQFIDQVDSSTYGSKMPRASWDFIGSLVAPVPKGDESDTIANFLDHETAKIDTLISSQEQLIKLLKEKRQAVISQAVTKGLNPSTPRRDSGVEWLGEVPAHWDRIQLKRLVSTPIIDGPHVTPIKQDNGVPFVSAEAISKGFVNFEKKWGYISKETHVRFSKRYSPQKGDIFLIKLGATTGVAAIVDTDDVFNIWVPLAAIRCNKKVLPYYLLNTLRSSSVQDAIKLSWTYGTQQTLGLKTLGNIYIPIPPPKEQKEIVDYLDQQVPLFEKLIRKAEDSIDLMQERRTALISAAVTGKIDLRHWQAPFKSEKAMEATHE